MQSAVPERKFRCSGEHSGWSLVPCPTLPPNRSGSSTCTPFDLRYKGKKTQQMRTTEQHTHTDLKESMYDQSR